MNKFKNSNNIFIINKMILRQHEINKIIKKSINLCSFRSLTVKSEERNNLTRIKYSIKLKIID